MARKIPKSKEEQALDLWKTICDAGPPGELSLKKTSFYRECWGLIVALAFHRSNYSSEMRHKRHRRQAMINRQRKIQVNNVWLARTLLWALLREIHAGKYASLSAHLRTDIAPIISGKYLAILQTITGDIFSEPDTCDKRLQENVKYGLEKMEKLGYGSILWRYETENQPTQLELHLSLPTGLEVLNKSAEKLLIFSEKNSGSFVPPHNFPPARILIRELARLTRRRMTVRNRK